MPSIKELCRVLGINHPEDQSTCIGFGKRKPTCGLPVAAASRFAAANGLVDICDALAHGVKPSTLGAQLKDVARLLHCKRYHQDQAPSKAEEWCDRLIEYVEQRQRARHERRVQSRTSSSGRRHLSNSQIVSPTGPAASSLSSIRVEDLLGELASRLQSQGQTITAVEAIMANYRRMDNRRALSPIRAASRRRDVEVSDQDESSSEEDSEEEGSSDERSVRSTASRRAARPVLPLNPGLSGPPRLSPSSSRRPSLPSPSSSSSTSSRATTSSSSSSSSETECGICLSRLPASSRRNSNNIWRCTTCHNATHAMCFDEWMARSADNRATCIYCRSPVATN